MSNLQGMYVNGPMAGRIINLPNPVPERLTAAVNLQHCRHSNPEVPISMTMLEYTINKPANDFLPYVITLTSKFDDTGWYCPTCKAEAEVKYKLEQIRELLEDDDE